MRFGIVAAAAAVVMASPASAATFTGTVDANETINFSLPFTGYRELLRFVSDTPIIAEYQLSVLIRYDKYDARGRQTDSNEIFGGGWETRGPGTVIDLIY